ncbi:MAG: BMP family ABC transporter substrate-binding protein [Ardenticatenaceae bacterium]|nr:BMP family ABC transporter substrate-binding protein [Anaerolineales bacterium]MCB8977766.1 BMP family ABC transporter substrate-binding protein [Ardenticatenaceae bacterium]
MKRTLYLLFSVLLLTLFLAACGGEEEEDEFSFALVLPGQLGDRSFADSSNRGAERAIEELGVKGTIIETTGISEHEAAMRGAIQAGNDIVLPLALDAQLLLDLAAEFPDQKFGAPSDVFAESLPDNVAAFQINVHESSFLVGLIAGSMTETKIVGAVVGGDAPSLNQFFYGYKQGVLEVCPDCQVLVGYLGFDFNNPTLGLETALGQYEQGADIVYQVAGRSGEGVLEAAKQTGNFAIGVDSNQDWIQPGSVIVSMLKRVDVTTYTLIEWAKNGTFKGGFNELGMAEGAAGISWDEGSTTFEEEGPADMVAKLPAVKETVETYRQQILDGAYEVCDALNPTPVCDPLMNN